MPQVASPLCIERCKLCELSSSHRRVPALQPGLSTTIKLCLPNDTKRGLAMRRCGSGSWGLSTAPDMKLATRHIMLGSAVTSQALVWKQFTRVHSCDFVKACALANGTCESRLRRSHLRRRSHNLLKDFVAGADLERPNANAHSRLVHEYSEAPG